jgi:hypothetical protein
MKSCLIFLYGTIVSILVMGLLMHLSDPTNPTAVPVTPKEDRTTLCTLRVSRMANKLDVNLYNPDIILKVYKECLDEKK